MITTEMVKSLREATGAGIADCKRALEDAATGGKADLEVEAKRLLTLRGLDKSREIAGRQTSAGRVFTYVHGEGRVGVLCEVLCESDFVARCEAFKTFGHELCLQIAAVRPVHVSRDVVPAGVKADQQLVIAHQLDEDAQQKGKALPENIKTKVVDGRMGKWYSEVCLLDQPWVKDPKQTIEQLRAQLASTVGENIRVRRFERFEAGV